MSKYPGIFNREPWSMWFAWHPVKIGGRWRFFSLVERRRVFCAGAGFAMTVGHEYRATTEGAEG